MKLQRRWIIHRSVPNNIPQKEKQMTGTQVRVPTIASLVELMDLGFIFERDVLPGGGVDENIRREAERCYRLNYTPRPSTSRPSTSQPSTSQPSTSRPYTAPPYRYRPVSTTEQTGTAHIHRLRIRRNVDDRERRPQPLKLDTCCICFARTRDHAFAPCYHMCVCGTCAPRLTRCPMCRQDVQGVHRIWM